MPTGVERLRPTGAPVRHSRGELLAWAGWRLLVPEDWRPLKLLGSPLKGQMIVGDADRALLSVQWERLPRHATHDGPRWVAQRLDRLGLQPDPSPPAAQRFSHCAWAHEVQTEEGKGTTYWLGYADHADLLLALKVNGVLPAAERRLVTRRVLPTLTAGDPSQGSLWAMYGLSFRAPAGFELARRHLFSGDVAMEFRRGQRERLMLRQVYPGDLALGRRSLERWLEAYPFLEHRRLRRGSVRLTPWRDADRPELVGQRRAARKRLPLPLGGLLPFWSSALAVHDRALNRLLIAEHLAPVEPDGSLVAAAVTQMNSSPAEDP